MKTLLMFVLFLAACHRHEPSRSSVPSGNPTAFCGSSCWNNSNCTGSGGYACGNCVSGTCSSRIPVAVVPDELRVAER